LSRPVTGIVTLPNMLMSSHPNRRALSRAVGIHDFCGPGRIGWDVPTHTTDHQSTLRGSLLRDRGGARGNRRKRVLPRLELGTDVRRAAQGTATVAPPGAGRAYKARSSFSRKPRPARHSSPTSADDEGSGPNETDARGAAQDQQLRVRDNFDHTGGYPPDMHNSHAKALPGATTAGLGPSEYRRKQRGGGLIDGPLLGGLPAALGPKTETGTRVWRPSNRLFDMRLTKATPPATCAGSFFRLRPF